MRMKTSQKWWLQYFKGEEVEIPNLKLTENNGFAPKPHSWREIRHWLTFVGCVLFSVHGIVPVTAMCANLQLGFSKHWNWNPPSSRGLHLGSGSPKASKLASSWHSLIPLLHSFVEDFRVIGPAPRILARVGEDALLTCQLFPKRSVEHMEVRWYRSEPSTHVLFVHRDGAEVSEMQAEEYRGRVEWVEHDLAEGSVALKMHNIQPSDDGQYWCRFQEGDDHGETSLLLQVAGEYLGKDTRSRISEGEVYWFMGSSWPVKKLPLIFEALPNAQSSTLIHLRANGPEVSGAGPHGQYPQTELVWFWLFLTVILNPWHVVVRSFAEDDLCHTGWCARASSSLSESSWLLSIHVSVELVGLFPPPICRNCDANTSFFV